MSDVPTSIHETLKTTVEKRRACEDILLRLFQRALDLGIEMVIGEGFRLSVRSKEPGLSIVVHPGSPVTSIQHCCEISASYALPSGEIIYGILNWHPETSYWIVSGNSTQGEFAIVDAARTDPDHLLQIFADELKRRKSAQ